MIRPTPRRTTVSLLLIGAACIVAAVTLPERIAAAGWLTGLACSGAALIVAARTRRESPQVRRSRRGASEGSPLR